MPNKTDLDNMLSKLIDFSDQYLDYSIENSKFSKDLVESIAVILSVAYERIDSIAK